MKKTWRWASVVRRAIGAALVTIAAGACSSGVDDRFAAESYDEYTEPLTDVVIGEPGKPVPDSAVAPGAEAAAAPATDAGPSSFPSGFGFWHFDDCSPNSHFLVDSSGAGANAQQALDAACVEGIAGLGVQFRKQKDVVQVPDEPQFSVDQRVAVAAWVHPTTVSGDQPIVIKRLNNKTAFSLGIHNGNIEMSVVLTTGKTFISRAPITPGVWSHVGGTYDGRFVFLFLNGEQVGQVASAGTLRNVFAPIRIGATTQTQHFDGIIDDVFLSTNPITKDEIIALSCIRRPSTIAVNPPTSGPVQAGTSFHYDVTATNNDVGSCGGSQYEMFFNFFDPNITTSVNPFFSQDVQPGQAFTFGADVRSTEDVDEGPHVLPFTVFKFGQTFESLSGQLTYEVAPPTGCFVRTKRELMITHTSVVDDPVRAAGGGAWSFGGLMSQVSPVVDENAPASQAGPMVEKLFQTWLTDQTVNGFRVPARPAIQQVLFDNWPRIHNGELGLSQAPLRLQAIVNRMDLRDLEKGSAGEARFVFAVNGPGGFFPQQFTVILEYNLPAKTEQDVRDWANLWHGLSSHPFPSEEYNAALEALTRRFTDRGSAPGQTNGSALLRLRTNEIALSFRWELREFVLSPETGFFAETTVKLTPDLGFNQTPTLARFVNQNAAAIVAEKHTVPEQFEGTPFLAGSVFNDLIVWSAPGIADGEARFRFSLNTCNGCHGPETNTSFLQINPRFLGSEATLSPFLTGTTVFDRTTGQVRTLNELARRKDAFTQFLCSTP
jgi:hypothetical protein